jgi:phage replication O-like protein O
MRIPPPNYTQTPNALFDYWLPLLKEVEVKVLFVIARKTFGWHKQKDVISLSQLSKLTGCTETNVSKAVKSLIQKRIVRKQVTGKIGTQETTYELIVGDVSEEDLNNSDPSSKERGTPPKKRGGTPPKLGGTKESLFKEKKQQQEKKKIAVVFSDKKMEDKKSIQKKKDDPIKQKISELLDIYDPKDVPIKNKIWITKKYNEAEIEKANLYVASRKGVFNESLLQTLLWACREQPEITPSKAERDKLQKQADEETIDRHRRYVKQYEGRKGNGGRIVVETNCVQNRLSEPIRYLDPGFMEQFHNMLRKMGIEF